MKYGSLVRETITVPKALTETSIDVRYDRSSPFSMDVAPENVDVNLVHLYSRPVTDHESYRPPWAPDHERYGAETCRQWVLVYRYYPQIDPERSEALSELLDKS
jgi:hypothetical protein|tara:strand:+ start:3141 stop:3452 length:312 start_codon:yes stop_codon:yes gene_type:complete